MPGDVDLVRYIHSPFHPTDGPFCHVHGPICSNALLWHPELPVHLYLHPLHNTSVSFSLYCHCLSAYLSLIVAAVAVLNCSLHVWNRPDLAPFAPFFTRGHPVVNIDLRSPNSALCLLATLRLLPSALVSLALSPSAPSSISLSPTIYPTLLSWKWSRMKGELVSVHCPSWLLVFLLILLLGLTHGYWALKKVYTVRGLPGTWQNTGGRGLCSEAEKEMHKIAGGVWWMIYD